MKLKKKEKNNQDYCPVELDGCLAKTEIKENEIVPGMSVEQHCLLSGYVSRCVAEVLPYLQSEGLFPVGYDTVVALHDIGKISNVFQWNIYSNLSCPKLPAFVSDPKLDTSSPSLRHTAVGQAYLNDEMRNRAVGQIVAAHHGIISSLLYNATDNVFGGVGYNNARKVLQIELEKSFNHTIPLADSISKEEQLFLTGLTVVSDWISSARSISELQNCTYQTLAERAVNEAGFEKVKVRKGLSFEDVFGFTPRPSQRTFYEMVDEPGVYILEAEMGQGKTEAALFAAYRLLEKGESTGIYFALPTRLTSVSIHKRVETFLDRILEDHRRTKLIFQNSDLYDYQMEEDCEEDHDWFDSAKRSILYPLGVGTVDQALMSVINVKHSALRAFGLAGKTVIIDELHSYDVYTGSLVRKLINLVLALKGTVIILSATLQDEVKNQILGTDKTLSPYPMASGCIAGKYVAKGIPAVSEKKITIVKSGYDNAIEVAIDAYCNGQNVLWIENTVEEAQNAYRVFVSRVGNIGDVGLLHSQFTEEDRQKNESEWLTYFGKNQKGRKCGAILVGTQVLEQSLDIDADVLFTNIAPVDMLLQRMGRLWRHPGLNEYRKVKEPVCYIIAPELDSAGEKPETVFGKSGFVYSPYVLYRTLKVVSQYKSITIPRDIRGLIEAVYCKETPENNRIAGLLQELEKKKSELENQADYASSNICITESDESAKTRVSDIKTVSILIVKGYDYKRQHIKFMDNSEHGLDRHNRRIIARKILESSVKVSIGKTISAQPDDYLSPLKPFVYISDNPDERLRIMTIDDHGMLHGDFSQNNENSFSYSRKMGYFKIKEEQ